MLPCGFNINDKNSFSKIEDDDTSSEKSLTFEPDEIKYIEHEEVNNGYSFIFQQKKQKKMIIIQLMEESYDSE